MIQIPNPCDFASKDIWRFQHKPSRCHQTFEISVEKKQQHVTKTSSSTSIINVHQIQITHHKLNFVNVVATCLLFCFFKGCLSLSVIPACVCDTCFNQISGLPLLSHMCYHKPNVKHNIISRHNIIGVPPSYLRKLELLVPSRIRLVLPYKKSQPENYHGFVEMGPRPVEGDGTTACPTWRCWEILIRNENLLQKHFENKHRSKVSLAKKLSESFEGDACWFGSTCLVGHFTPTA